MHPLNIIQLWAPFALKGRYYAEHRVIDANTHEMGLYTTAFSTVALAWLAIRWRKLPQRRFVLATFLFALFMLGMALGKYGGVYLLVSQLPVISSLPLRCPSRYSMLTELAMAVLAAVALADLLALQRAGERIKWSALWPLGVVFLLAAITAVAALAIASQPTSASAQLLGSTAEIVSGFALVACAVVLVAAAARGARWGVYGIVFLTAGEIGWFNMYQYLWNPPHEPLPGMAASVTPKEPALRPMESLTAIEASVSTPPKTDAGRLCLLGTDSDHGNMLAVMGYELMKGYTAIAPKERMPVLLRGANGQIMLDIPALRLASIHWVKNNEQWLASPAPMPRARLVSQTAACKEEDLVKAAYSIDPATTALLDRPLDPALEFGSPGTANIKNERPGRMEIETVAPTRQLLVVSERYHPGWRATVDGKPVRLQPAYGEYLSCVVPAGTRKVEMIFEPASFAAGQRLTIAGLVLALLMAGGILFWPVSRGPARVDQAEPGITTTI